MLLAAGGILMPGFGIAQEPVVPPEQTETKDATPCEYEAGGKKTWQELVSGQCMPKRCLQHCARYGASQLDPDTPLVDGGETLTVNLVHCAISCWRNEAGDLPEAKSFDLPCRRYTEWPADYPQNWLPPGQVCDSAHERACLYGRCLGSNEFVLQALDGYFTSGTGEAWYLRAISFAKQPAARKTWHREFEYTAQTLIGHTQLRPPGPLVRPDWKKVQREDYEREQAKKAKEEAESGQ
jgi:hypothetical protein